MSQISCAITGSSGYVGKHIVHALRQQGCSVYELGRSKQRTQLENFFLEFSLNQSVFPNLQDIDVLIHCAYDFSADTMKKSEEININASLRLFEHAKAHGVKKIILISSMSSFENARSVYGKTKFLMEKQAQKFGAIIVRPGLIFGEKTAGIVGAMQQFVKKFPIVPLTGLGNQKFYACYIADLCRLIFYLVANNITSEKPIIAASQQAITFRQLVSELAKSKNKKVLLIPVPFNVIWLGIKILEILNLNIGLRSDSLISTQFYNTKPDFSGQDALINISFSNLNSELI